jgi:hypothetical protein
MRMMSRCSNIAKPFERTASRSPRHRTAVHAHRKITNESDCVLVFEQAPASFWDRYERPQDIIFIIGSISDANSRMSVTLEIFVTLLAWGMRSPGF